MSVAADSIERMSGCTAPVEGHRTASGAANCPVCRYRGSRRSSYSAPSYTPRSYSSYSAPSYTSRSSVGSGGSSGGTRPRWSSGSSSVTYTHAQVRELDRVRTQVEVRAQAHPEFFDVFLCHAWDDRRGAAKQLCDLLKARGVTVWFSEENIGLGVPFMRAIDKGLAKSRAGIVLVTPALLKRLPTGGVADKELSELLARDLLIPIVHETTYEALREESPLLASRNGLDTADDSMEDIAIEISELVNVTGLGDA